VPPPNYCIASKLFKRRMNQRNCGGTEHLTLWRFREITIAGSPKVITDAFLKFPNLLSSIA
jgi:hypothetical protein